MKFPKWQLHRGFWKAGVRENTMEAFRQAKEMNCPMVELDVRLSRDGVPHIFHDATLKKFFHVDQKVVRTKSEDLSGLNIPMLREVLESEEVPEFLNIEVKSIDLFCFFISRKVCGIIAQYGRDKKVLISSFNPMVLYWVKRFLPKVNRALIVGEKGSLMNWKMAASLKLAEPHFLNCHYKLIDDDESRERVISYGKPIMVWTVNDHDKAQFYLARGAKSIISDLPPKIK